MTSSSFRRPTSEVLLRRSLLVVTTCVIAGCHPQPKEYVIGAAGPQHLPYGVLNEHGIELAVDEINRAGGINGIPLHLLIRDDRANGAEATRIAAELASDPKVLGVVGHVNSAAMVSAARAYDSGKLVAIATSASSPDLTDISPWVFRMITSDSTNGVALARFASTLEQSFGRKVRAAILYQNDAYGRGLATAFARSFHGEIISSDPVSGTTPMEPYVAYFKRRKPDIVLGAGDETSGLPFIREARRQQLNVTLIGGDGWQPLAGDSSAEGIYIGVPFTAQSADTAAQRFVAAYRAKYGEVPNGMAALAYDATKLLAQAIAHGNGRREGVRSYLANLKTSNAYHGVSGVTWFNSNNDPAGDHFRITRVAHGAMLPLGGTALPLAVATR